MLYLPKSKFIVLEFDAESTSDFRVFCIFNFQNDDALKFTGKKFPMEGMLRSVTGTDPSGFSFIGDDTVLTFVQFLPLKKNKQQHDPLALLAAQNEPKINPSYLNVMVGAHYVADKVKPENLVKPACFFNLKNLHDIH